MLILAIFLLINSIKHNITYIIFSNLLIISVISIFKFFLPLADKIPQSANNFDKTQIISKTRIPVPYLVHFFLNPKYICS